MLYIQLPQTQNEYPYDVKLFLSVLGAYSVIRFLNDIEHIRKHKWINTEKCKMNNNCTHFKRANRNRKKCKDLSKKKNYLIHQIQMILHI